MHNSTQKPSESEPPEAWPPLYIIFHIPKTAGQTLRQHFLSHLELHKSFVHLGPFGNEDAKAKGVPPLAERPVALRQQARVVLGHDVNSKTAEFFPDRDVRLITFVRDPAEQMVSLYNFTMEYSFRQMGQEPISFDNWYVQNRKNTCLRWLDRAFFDESDSANVSEAERFDRVAKLLNGFWMVGTIETFSNDANTLMKAAGLPMLEAGRANVSGRDFAKTIEMTSELRAKIYADCSHDVALHRYALRRRIDNAS